MSLTEISKTISQALRHTPSDYGLFLDENGYVEYDDLLEVLCLKGHKADIETIKQILDSSEKKRFEIVGTKIRALYGHSIQTIEYTKVTENFPEHLYHATEKTLVDLILKEGLKSMGRQYIHFSSNLNLAKEAAKRKTKDIIVFEIDLQTAIDDGIEFYNPSENIWLAKDLSAKCISTAQ
jgi:putative RNA 2'-phosphotransferase